MKEKNDYCDMLGADSGELGEQERRVSGVYLDTIELGQKTN